VAHPLTERVRSYSVEISEGEVQLVRRSQEVRKHLRTLTMISLTKKDILAILSSLRGQYYIYRTGFDILEGSVEPSDFILLRPFRSADQISGDETKKDVWICLHTDLTIDCFAGSKQTADLEIDGLVKKLENALDTKIFALPTGKNKELELLRAKVRKGNLRLAIPLISLVLASGSVVLALSQRLDYAVYTFVVASIAACLVFHAGKESVDKVESML